MNQSTGIIVAGLQSSSGKTALTCMLLAALVERGCLVQPFKVGPDFIDPGYHTHYAAQVSRNLDSWMMGVDGVRAEILAHGAGRVSVVEGVMGLFDGNEVSSDAGSAMELARLMDWPVLLIVPSAKVGRSLAATLRGFLSEAGVGRIAGVILNQVSGASHADYLREAIAPLGIPVLGALPKCELLAWPERHLGLQASQEGALPTRVELGRLAEQYIDIPALLTLLRPAPAAAALSAPPPARRRIAVARDEAFHFYYQANLDYLQSQGAELVNFSPLHDRALPAEIDGCFIGGGFPEVYADALAQNQALRTELLGALRAGLPCYAECGGLMLLAEELLTSDGRRYPMVGAVPGKIEMTAGLQNFGYCTCSEQTFGGRLQGAPDFRGHEFHYSRWLAEPSEANLWQVRRKRSGQGRREGFALAQLRASYVHLHFPTSPAAISNLLDRVP